MTTTTAPTADALDELTDQQEAAHEAAALARAEHQAARFAASSALAAAHRAGTAPDVDEHLDRLAVARERLELAELLEEGLAEVRRQITPRGRPTPPAAGDPRGIVRICPTGRPGKYACNQPSTGRELVAGEVYPVTFDDAVALCSGGYAEVVGAVPDGWPRTIPATGQLAASLA